MAKYTKPMIFFVEPTFYERVFNKISKDKDGRKFSEIARQLLIKWLEGSFKV